MAFHAMDFEISIEFSWAPLLVELKRDPQFKRVLHLDLIEDNARYWKGAGILVFDSAHWWTHTINSRADYGWKCYKQREPLLYFSHAHIAEPMVVLKGVLRNMRFLVYLQDITNMSALRRGGHPSVYNRALEQQVNQNLKQHNSDCSHWCLPGVPDAWNEMLSAIL